MNTRIWPPQSIESYFTVLNIGYLNNSKFLAKTNVTEISSTTYLSETASVV
jgi:hypothetical protein